MLLPWGSLSRLVFPATYHESHTKYLPKAEGVRFLVAEKKKGHQMKEEKRLDLLLDTNLFQFQWRGL